MTRLDYPTDELLERIADAQWNGSGEGVDFSDIHQHDACNHTLSGTIKDGDVTYGFIIESGNWNGTVVHEWGHPDDVGFYKPDPPGEMLTFIPNRILNERELRAYLAWREEEWFKEKARSYLYDRHFQPGGLIERHYSKWAAGKGLTIGLLSNVQGIPHAVNKDRLSKT